MENKRNGAMVQKVVLIRRDILPQIPLKTQKIQLGLLY